MLDRREVPTRNFSVPDRDYILHIQDGFHRQGFMRHIGARIAELGPGTCTLIVDFSDDLVEQHGFFQGGVVAALCDNAAAYAAFTLIEVEQSMLTVGYQVNLVAPASGSKLKAAGEVVRIGRMLTVCRVLATAVASSAAEQVCALATVTMMTLTSRGDGR
jgi:uncharacterized protein (TIGR00369 family)